MTDTGYHSNFMDRKIKEAEEYIKKAEVVPKEPMTNEDWFCGLSTTEKSEFLSTMVKEAIEVHEKHGITWHEAVSWWDGWLKGEHKA